MKNLRWYVGLLLGFVACAGHLHATPKVVCMTMPKCGTHLLAKCISLFGVPGLHIDDTFAGNIQPTKHGWAIYDRLNIYDPPHHFKGRLHVPTMGPRPWLLENNLRTLKRKNLFVSHWPYTTEALALLRSKHTKNFFIIRDPRAMLVSMAFMLSKGWRGETTDPQKLMRDFIDGRQQNFIRWGVTVHESYPVLWELGIVGFYKLYLPWMKAPGFHTVRFERLVGAKGGGSEKVQLEEINAIARHIGVKLSDQKIIEIRDKLFGGSITFREGSIDGWKKHFTPEMKQAFKNTPGANELLVQLGYEKDSNW